MDTADPFVGFAKVEAGKDTSDATQRVLDSQKESAMSTISYIWEAILSLREPEFAELKKWLSGLEAERRWDEWDEQIETDSDRGKLDFLISEALKAKVNGTLSEF